jgi:hypothetical protein
MTLPIPQFGTGRFLQAHVDFFVEANTNRGVKETPKGGIALRRSECQPCRQLQDGPFRM